MVLPPVLSPECQDRLYDQLENRTKNILDIHPQHDNPKHPMNFVGYQVETMPLLLYFQPYLADLIPYIRSSYSRVRKAELVHSA
ncbi:hypothetical protein GS16_00505 [Candidatus Liberibacter solanacearum]|nr:hypothetical protein GS16_00505 [Candidatus Liberibacter solanacearum]